MKYLIHNVREQYKFKYLKEEEEEDEERKKKKKRRRKRMKENSSTKRWNLETSC